VIYVCRAIGGYAPGAFEHARDRDVLLHLNVKIAASNSDDPGVPMCTLHLISSDAASKWSPPRAASDPMARRTRCCGISDKPMAMK
jgi:hypothetical protein